MTLVLYIALVQHYYGWQAIISTWQLASGAQVIGSLLLLFFTYAMRAARIYYYFPSAQRCSFASSLKVMLLHNLLNNLLPMRTGEASFPLLMRHEFATSLTTATSLLLLFRVMDLHILLIVGGICYLALGQHFALAAWFLVCTMLLPLSLFPLLNRFKLRSNQWPTNLFTHYLQRFLRVVPAHFYGYLSMWVLSWLNWGIKIVIFTYILLWFAPDTWSALTACFAGELSAIFPIHTPAGLGTYEAAMVGISALMGVRGDWILFAGVQLHLFIIISTCLGAIVGYLIPSQKAHLALSHE